MSYEQIREVLKPVGVMCISENCHDLTFKKKYPVIQKLKHPEYTFYVYRLKNDKGVITNYFHHNFKEINKNVQANI